MQKSVTHDRLAVLVNHIKQVVTDATTSGTDIVAAANGISDTIATTSEWDTLRPLMQSVRPPRLI